MSVSSPTDPLCPDDDDVHPRQLDVTRPLPADASLRLPVQYLAVRTFAPPTVLARHPDAEVERQFVTAVVHDVPIEVPVVMPTSLDATLNPALVGRSLTSYDESMDTSIA